MDLPAPFTGNPAGYVAYKRTYARECPKRVGDAEEWEDTIDRCITGIKALPRMSMTAAEESELRSLLLSQKCILAGRFLFQLGTDNIARTGLLSLQNCAATVVDCTDAFVWTMKMLMYGAGVGFNIQRQYTDQLPGPLRFSRATRLDTMDADFIVPDSRDGWAGLLKKVLRSHFVTGRSFTYSTKCLRSRGAPIKCFGGTASGPELLCDGVAKIEDVLNSRTGEKMRPVDCLDIMNIIASIVAAGNVRRSATIALGDPDDIDFLLAKRWDLGKVPNYRAFSNNSVVTSDTTTLPPEFWETYRVGGEPIGLVNMDAIRTQGRLGDFKHPDPDAVCVNPCGEQPLENRATCCLGELVLPKIESPEELWKCTQWLYRVCKHSLLLPAPIKSTEEIVHRQMRMGISVSGYLQAPESKRKWLAANYKSLREFDAAYSSVLGIPESIKLTTIKPAGTTGLVTGVTPGLHPGFARFFIRRIRMDSGCDAFKWCQTQGFEYEYERQLDGTLNHSTAVVSFPCRLPPETVLVEDITAIDQLEFMKRLQTEWSDNSCSITVQYRPDELPAIHEWLAREYRDHVKSVSFLLHLEHKFAQAPYEKIDESRYNEMVKRVARSRQSSLRVRAGGDDEFIGELECQGGMCPVR